MLTLKDIAEVANVSVSTVSRVLNDKSNISEATKARVHRIIADLAYKPGTVLRRFTARTYRIGLFVPQASEFVNDDPGTSVDLNTLRSEFEKRKHKVQLITRESTLDADSAVTRTIRNREFDGAVVCDPFLQDEIVTNLASRGIPCIVTNGRFHDSRYSYIDYNNEEGARLAMTHLWELGHRTLGIIEGPGDHLVTANRKEGCRHAIAASPQPLTVHETGGPFSLDAGYRCAQKLLADHPQITAIFAFSDSIAFGAMKAIKEAGRRIPDDLSIVGFDDMALAQYTDPPLTTVRRFRYDINVLIVHALEDLIVNPNIERIQISLRTELIVRGSSQAPRASV